MAQFDTVFRLGADVGDAIDALKRAEKALEEVGNSTARPAQQVGVLQSQLNDFATAAGGSWKSAISGMGAAFGGMFAATAVIGGIKAAGAAVADFGRDCAMAAMEAERAERRLRVALDLRGLGDGALAGDLKALATEVQRTSRFSDEAAMAVEQYALMTGVAAGKIPALTRASADLAAAYGEDLSTAGEMLAQTLEGRVSPRLAKLVPELALMSDQALRSGEAIDVVAEHVRGFAGKDLDALDGALAQAGGAWGDFKEDVGGALTQSDDAKQFVREMTGLLRELTPVASGAMKLLAGSVLELTHLGDHFMDPIDASGVPRAPGMTQTYEDIAGPRRKAAAEAAMAEEARRDTERRARWAKEIEDERAAREAARAKDKKSFGDLFADYAVSVASTQSAMEGLGLSTKDQLAIVNDLIGKGDALGRSMLGAMQDPKADVVALANSYGQLGEELDALRAKSAELRTPDIAGGDAKFKDYAITAMDPSADRSGMGAGLASAALAGEPQGVFAEMESPEVKRAQEIIEVNAMLSDSYLSLDQVLSQAGVTMDALTNKEIRDIKAKVDNANAATRLQRNHGLLGSTLLNTGVAFAEMAVAGELSAKKILVAGLQALAEYAGKKAMEMAALAATYAAEENYPGAAKATAAAHMWGAVGMAAGAAAAIGGAALGGGGGGGREKRGDREFGDGMGTSSRDRATREAATAGGQSGPTYQFSFAGATITSAGGPEEFARLIHSEMRRLESDTSGRSGSRIL